MILYFSATGNSKYVAEKIAKELNDTAISMVEYIEKSIYDFEIDDGEKIGIVSPTYAWKLPLIVEEFLSRFKILAQDTPYIFLLLPMVQLQVKPVIMHKSFLERTN